MPTKKAIIQTVIENDTYNKFMSLKEKTGRSQSNLARYMIEQYIQQYEKEHGVIELSDNTTQGGGN